MKLLSLELKNYQGITALSFETEGKSIAVEGMNGTGKTTIANAIAWLLFGKSSTGEKNYNPKPIDRSGEEKHNLETAAIGVFELEDGTKIRLEKRFSEIWQKVRGNKEQTFKGHSTEYYIDEVPAKEKDYQERMSEICGPDLTQMLTIPDYFADQMPWQKRREVLLDVCGDVTDEEVFEASEEVSPLEKLLAKPGTSDQTYTVEEYAAIASERKKKLNAQLKDIPVRIDEATLSMPTEPEEPIGALKKEKESFEAALLDLKSDDTKDVRKMRTEIEAKIAAVKLEKSNAEGEYLKAQRDATRDKREALAHLEADKQQTMSGISSAQRLLTDLSGDKGYIERKRSELIAEYTAKQKETWAGSETCPTCGQALPEESVKEAKETFNRKKSERLEELNAKGQAYSKDKIKEIEDKIADQYAAIEKLKAEAGQTGKKIEELEAEISYTMSKGFSTTEEAREFDDKLQELEASLMGIEATMQARAEASKDKIAELEEKIHKTDVKISDYAVIERQKARIAELEEEEARIAEDYEQAEYAAYLCELFTRVKAELLDEKINDRFKSIRFKLYKTQINGGQTDDCTVMVSTTEGLKPYAKANTGAKMRAGIELMDTLGTHYGVHMPLLLDNFESITNEIEPTKAQQIRLIAKEGASLDIHSI